MANNRPNIHLVCNAHIDPVWLWQWEEGLAEAISTFRTAAEFCEQFNNFVFNHNEALLYKWIEEYDPELFQRIHKLIKAGKWNIIGGWVVQPDCNMPSGESFVRQILLGKNYFKDRFDVDVTTAVNFDSFGHTRGLVQILAKSGYDSYFFCRPQDEFCRLESDDFVWVGFDGSEITACRYSETDGMYSSFRGKARQKIEKWLEQHRDKEYGIIPWGMGNHGGGPSRVDLYEIGKLMETTKEFNIIHSTPQRYFQELKQHKAALSRFTRDLNAWSIGCYTSQIRLKQKHRQLENEIYSLEKMASAAFCQGLAKYPYEQINEALGDLMLLEFHDIICGSSVQQAEEASLRLAEHGLEITSRLKARMFFALARGQEKAKEGEIPILVYNPHPYKLGQTVECEFNLSDPDFSDNFTQVKIFHNGKTVPCQLEHESCSLDFNWRKKIVFQAELVPGAMNRFDCQTEKIGSKPKRALQARNGRISFKTPQLDVVINSRTGLVDRYRVNGTDYVRKNAFEPIVVEDNEDSWEQKARSFRKVIGRFKLMSKKACADFCGLKVGTIDSVHVIEDGPVRSVVEAIFSYGNSFVCQRYKLPKLGTEVEVETRVYWNEKNRMLKLSIPTAAHNCRYLGQAAYGVGELSCNGDEAVAQKCVAVVSEKDDMALTCINNGIYGSDFSPEGLRLTLLRSPAYACAQILDRPLVAQDRFTPRIDQGEHLFSFWVNAGGVSERLSHIDREALVKNEKPFALSVFPSGKGRQPRPLAVLSDDVVQITTIKRAEKSNNELIVRLYEPTGHERTTVLSLPCIGVTTRVSLGGFEIKTLRVNLDSSEITEVDLLERVINSTLKGGGNDERLVKRNKVGIFCK